MLGVGANSWVAGNAVVMVVVIGLVAHAGPLAVFSASCLDFVLALVDFFPVVTVTVAVLGGSMHIVASI
jgi:hypothetical protein